MTRIVPIATAIQGSKRPSEPSTTDQHAGDAMAYLFAGMDAARGPDRTAIAVIATSDPHIARKARAMRTAMQKVATESADLNIREPVSDLMWACNDKVLARLFDLAAAAAEPVTRGA